jgi:hypothetical protein
MRTHNGYTTKGGKSQCSKCDEWIENGDEAVLMLPSEVGDRGVETNAKAIHGVLCMTCYKEI